MLLVCCRAHRFHVFLINLFRACSARCLFLIDLRAAPPYLCLRGHALFPLFDDLLDDNDGGGRRPETTEHNSICDLHLVMAAILLGSALSWADTIVADAAFVDPLSLSEVSSPWSTPALARRDSGQQSGKAQDARGIGIVSFLTAIGVAAAIFAAQFTLFTLLRNKLARILYVHNKPPDLALPLLNLTLFQQAENVPSPRARENRVAA